MVLNHSSYRGRLAPSPTGYLHLGHARTFWIAARRAQAAGGTLSLRNDDLDRERCREDFVVAMQEDLRWLGLNWQGPMISQSERGDHYRKTLERLRAAGCIFPCTRSRRDVLEAASAPHEGSPDDEPIYPKHFRPPSDVPLQSFEFATNMNWRFRVPDDREIRFEDGAGGEQHAIAGRDFGDFLVWRKDDIASYQLATVVDDLEMGITEVVRGADLIKSTFRQLLLYEALRTTAPAFYHAPLMRDPHGQRLAKRHDALALRALRAQGIAPEPILERFVQETMTP